MKVVRAGIDERMKVDVEDVKQLLSPRTALIVGSAPNYPFGVVDEIEALSDVALDKGVWLHVDACLGGFILPFFKKLGEKVPEFDFSLEGVSSISADYHKYGFCPRGASVILYRNSELREGQIFVMASWPGYPLVNTAVLSTRSAGPLAATWAVVNFLGYDGYLSLAEKTLIAKRRLIDGLKKIGLELIGEPESSVLAFTSDKINLFRVSSIMAEKGWYVQSQPGSRELGFPKSLHFTVIPAHADVAEEFLEDMGKAVSMAGSSYPEVTSFDFSKLKLRDGLPEDMEVVAELIHSMPTIAVESTLRKIVNEVIFR